VALEVDTVNGEVVVRWVHESGVWILDCPMIPDEAKQLVNDLGAAIKFVVDEEKWLARRNGRDE
jgi:hypothetical protein